MKEKFKELKLNTARRALLDKSNAIMDEYAAQGYDLSLRQLYYQCVARGFIENSVKSYKRFGDLISEARLAGYLNWDMIRDRGRHMTANQHWRDPAEIVDAAARGFRINKWEDQPWHIEVMVEKDALSGVLEPVCQELDINFSANKGYSSSSTMYEAGKRLERLATEGKEICILYFGDHDPSGIDMTRDVTERLEMFSYGRLKVDRLALNMDQVTALNPPPNPAKETDSRFQAYLMEFGSTSWELDAVEPAALADMVRDAVAQLRDDDLWAEALERESAMRAELQGFVRKYERRKRK